MKESEEISPWVEVSKGREMGDIYNSVNNKCLKTGIQGNIFKIGTWLAVQTVDCPNSLLEYPGKQRKDKNWGQQKLKMTVILQPETEKIPLTAGATGDEL